MVRYLIILLFFQFAVTFAQVKNYQIIHSNHLSIMPYKVYNSNEGNILLSNAEANWDIGYSNILKTKTNGDTIFIKSTDTERIYVTSNGNILSNKTVYEIAIQNYTNSYITMRDKNLNVKWQMDLSSNFSGGVGYSNSPPLIGDFYELTPNKFICSVSSRSTSVGSPTGVPMIMEFDSSGTIKSIRTNWYLEYCNFGGKCNNNWVGYSDNRMIIANTTVLNNTQALKFNSAMSGIHSVCCKNNKIYTTLQGANYNKAVLSCLDTNLTVLWSKVIEPNDSTKYNYLEDLLFYNNTLIGKYHDDTSSYVLNFDTLGSLISSNKILLNAGDFITNLALVHDSVYTSKGNFNNFDISLIRMNIQGQFPCSMPANFLVHNNVIINSPVYTDSLRPTSFSYSLSNGGNSGFAYTVNLADECIVTGVNENVTEDIIMGIYPNPASSTVNIKIADNSEGVYKIKITDVLGREVFVSDYKEELNISSFEKGIYFVFVMQGNKTLVTKKLVKE